MSNVEKPTKFRVTYKVTYTKVTEVTRVVEFRAKDKEFAKEIVERAHALMGGRTVKEVSEKSKVVQSTDEVKVEIVEYAQNQSGDDE